MHRRSTRRNSTIPEIRVVGAAYLTTTTSRRRSPTPAHLDDEVAPEAAQPAVAGPALEGGGHASQPREGVGVLGGGEDPHAPHGLDLPAVGQRPPHPPQAVVADVHRLGPTQRARGLGRQRLEAPRVVDLDEGAAPRSEDPPDLSHGRGQVRDVGQHLERVDDVEAVVGEGQVGGRGLGHGEALLARGEPGHAGGKVDAGRPPGHGRGALEDEPRPAADLEGVATGDGAGHRAELEVVDDPVVALAPLALVPGGVVVVVAGDLLAPLGGRHAASSSGARSGVPAPVATSTPAMAARTTSPRRRSTAVATSPTAAGRPTMGPIPAARTSRTPRPAGRNPTAEPRDPARLRARDWSTPAE